MALRQPAQPLLQFVNRNGDRPGDMPCGVLVGRSRIKDDDITATKTGNQIFEGDGLSVGPVPEFLPNEPLEVPQPTLRHHSNGSRQFEHGRIRQ